MLLNQIKKMFITGTLTQQQYAEIKSDVCHKNKNVLKVYALFFSVVLFALGVSNAVLKVETGLLPLIAVCFAVWMSVLLFYKGRSDKATKVLVYLAVSMVLGYGLLVAYLNPDRLIISLLPLMCLVQVLFCLRPWVSNLITLLTMAIALLLIFLVRSPENMSIDTTNVIAFGLLSCVAGSSVNSSRLEGIYLARENKKLADRDALTGIYNRSRFMEDISQYREMATPLTCIYVDVNGLHELNNEKGHSEGDRIIRLIAFAFSRAFEKELSYRTGGDEFVFFTENTNEEEIKAIISEVKRKLSAKGAHPAVGYAICGEGEPFNEALTKAEKLMYKDKADYYKDSAHDRRRSDKNRQT